MKKYLLAGVFFLLFATPLIAAEKESVKIKLPDGVYMYDSEVQRQKDGTDRVGFEKYFVVHNNKIYGSIEAYEKFGLSKLNELFGGFFGLKEDKKYKILCGGEVVGKYFNLRFDKDDIDDDADVNCDELFFTKDIKEGPAYYWREIMYPGKLTSATKCLAVPEEYKEVKKKFYTTIPQEEVDKIEKLAKEKLLPLLINRKGYAKYKIREMELYKENLYLLDKISYKRDALYIGEYQYVFEKAKEAYHFKVVFSATKDNVHIVTTNCEEGDLVAGYMEIYGTLDVDGCGADELLIEKVAPREDEITSWLEMHKQKPDGKWTLIKSIKTRREL